MTGSEGRRVMLQMHIHVIATRTVRRHETHPEVTDRRLSVFLACSATTGSSPVWADTTIFVMRVIAVVSHVAGLERAAVDIGSWQRLRSVIVILRTGHGDEKGPRSGRV